MLTEFTVTAEEILDKFGPVSWFRGTDPSDMDSKREQFVMEFLQREYPGKYKLEEYYNQSTMSFKYRLKFDSEADEMWFKLKYQ